MRLLSASCLRLRAAVTQATCQEPASPFKKLIKCACNTFASPKIIELIVNNRILISYLVG